MNKTRLLPLPMPSLSLPLNLWETVKCDFKSLFPEDVFQMWFEPVVCLETSEDASRWACPTISQPSGSTTTTWT